MSYLSKKAVAFAMLGSVFMACPSSAFASQADNGTIYGISVEAGKVFFYSTGARTTQPGCATVLKRWVFDANTAAGQAMMSALLTFYSQAKTINVTGTGDCSVWGDTETVRYIIRQAEIP